MAGAMSRGDGSIARALRGEKYQKDEVNFQHPAAKADCDDCKYWKSPSSCDIVVGVVKCEDYCNKFERK